MNIPKILCKLRPGASWSFDGTDYAGITWHDGVQSKPSLSDMTAASLAVDKTEMWAKIKAERERRKFTSGFKVGTLWFNSDANSRSQYNTMLNMAGEHSLLATYAFRPAWKTMSGATTPMTVALVRQIRDAALINEAAIFDNAESHKTAMESSATPLSYNFSTGWPATF